MFFSIEVHQIIMLTLGFIMQVASVFLFLWLFKLLRCWGFLLLLGVSFFRLLGYVPSALYLWGRDASMSHGAMVFAALTGRIGELLHYLLSVLYVAGVIWCIVWMRKRKFVQFRPFLPGEDRAAK